ncbi:cell division protein SepF [Carboxydothermus islandicus]|uniref:Cell division protein SepF n=1 Tax=Carboxydothermus islandicus TaxID=661089 RepID=A0A1L8D3H4_9THEO|nr:cell division protein SepF [Carboxydothermus islandicus]GAV25723.1 cell division protein SepF [Carboxydothermus islandicus]
MSGGFLDKVLNFMGFSEEEEEEYVEKEPAKKVRGKANLVALPGMSMLKMMVFEPRSFDEVQSIADSLKSGSPVVVNLERIDGELGRRIIDFLMGTTYALGGHLHKINPQIYLFAPQNVLIEGEMREFRDKTFFNPFK